MLKNRAMTREKSLYWYLTFDTPTRLPLENAWRDGLHRRQPRLHAWSDQVCDRGKSTAHDAQGRGSVRRAQGARHCVLHMHHPSISLHLIGGQRHGEIIQESEHLLSPCEQGISGSPMSWAARCCQDGPGYGEQPIRQRRGKQHEPSTRLARLAGERWLPAHATALRLWPWAAPMRPSPGPRRVSRALLPTGSVTDALHTR